MRRLTITAAALVALVAITATAPPVLAQRRDIASAAPVIDRVDRDWLAAMKAKDADRLAEAYAPDALFILPTGETLAGTAAIADFCRKRVARIGQVLDGGIHRDGLAQGADGLLYEWGHGGSTTVDAAGHKATSGGPYLTVWKKTADGSWKIVRNLVF